MLRTLMIVALVGGYVSLPLNGVTQAAESARYCRFQTGNTVAFGVVEGDRVRQLDGDLFGNFSKTNKTFPLDDVTLLVPTEPTHVLAMAGNY